ncbi:stress responsive protein [Brucella endophytica]|uniref:Stress responsive protein n=1 Tax=Brucella endophytica TaxID=1963359 RepID=A0A916S5D1_9HYPH|nr:Dabb family protein [Brucella endophytica]GGA82250.1 stress responsive protein [Brucella endophytica]
MNVSAKGTAEGVSGTGNGRIHHAIYITLKDKSPAAVQKQLELGEKFLSNHPGELSFFPTVLAHNLTRHKQVAYLFNEDDFDVAFIMVFADRQSHDAYQVSDAHVNHFIPQSNPNWVKIRVFDSVEV